MRQEEINKIKDRAVASAKLYPCEDILREAGYPIRVRGNQAYSVCYSCGNVYEKKQSDKFSVNTDKNLYHCFKCNVGGGPAKLYSELNHTTFIEASLILAMRNKDISKYEYEETTKIPSNYNKLVKDDKVYRKFEEKEADENIENRAPAAICNLVYKHMLRMPEFALADDAREYLKHNRQLTDREIESMRFFSYKKVFSIDALIENIKKEMPSFNLSMLCGVPGFFFEYISEKSGKWRFKDPYEECLGIPLMNAKGEIVALQMRYMGKNKTKNKYFYVSSKKVKEDGKRIGYGCSSGTPVGVCYPHVIKNDILYIGEGMFKMHEVAKEGSVALSLQGVNTYPYVLETVQKLMQMNVGIKRFCIVYDADMFVKSQVIEAAIMAAKFLKEHFPETNTYILVWDFNLGKGYDDMKFYCLKNGINYRKEVKAIAIETFVSCTQKAYKLADQEYLNSEYHKSDKLTDSDLRIRRNKNWGRFLYQHLYKEQLALI